MRKIVKWSREKVLEEIRAFHKSGRPLNWAIVTTEHRYHSKLPLAAIRYFGSWQKAVEAAGFVYKRLIRKWSKEKIVAEINKLNEAGEWLTYTEVYWSHFALVRAAIRYFGGWGKAVKAAGFPYELIKKMRQKESCLIGQRAGRIKWSEERVITQIRLFHRFKRTLQLKEIMRTNRKLFYAACGYFGSWRRAVEAAGFDYDQFLAERKWTKEKVISEIKALYKTNKTLEYKKVFRDNRKFYLVAYRFFGSWRKAVKAAGFDYDQFLPKRQRVKEKIISAIQAFYKGKGTLHYREIWKDPNRLYWTACNCFGNWRNAVEAAGFDYDQFLTRCKWAREKVVSEIQAFYRDKGTLRHREVLQYNRKLLQAACKRFGSWRGAVEAAGFDYDQFLPERKWTKERIISQIKAFYEAKGTFRYTEIRRDSMKLYAVALKYFGSWRNAVEAAGFDYAPFSSRKKE